MKFTIGNTTKEISNNLFSNLNPDNLCPSYIYAELFGTLPIYKCEYNLDYDNGDNDDIYTTVFNELDKSGEFKILTYEYSNNKKEFQNDHGEPELDENLYTNRFILVSNTEPVMISYYYGSLIVMSHLGKKKINEIIDKHLKKYIKVNNDAKCYIIIREQGNLFLNDFSIKLENDLDFSLYNEGFEHVHNDMVKSIKEDNNGLYLLYGKPGTGKTTYIRHLIKECETDNRKFIYVPSNLFCEFTNPSFLPFLMGNKGCIFIIEDCESIVTTVDGTRSYAISDLLNMSDGLLADALDIKIICTFNIDDGQIDDALLRQGRCRCKYEFDLLKKDRANEAAERLGLEHVDKDIALAELFNSGKSFIEEKKKKIGFNI